MPSTTELDLVYPDGNDLPDGPYALQQLAESTEAAILEQHRAGVHVIAAPMTSSFASSAVTFSTPFPPGVIPVVTGNSMDSTYHVVRIESGTVTNTGFVIQVRDSRTTNITAQINLSWQAMVPR